MQPRDASHAKGIDVSHYQGAVDWKQVRSAGYVFAFIKATEGTSIVDSKFTDYTAGAREAGLKIGAYHFCRASSAAEARQEAGFFMRTVNSAGGFDLFELPPVLDIETDNGQNRSTLTTIAREWVNAVQSATGRAPMIYTYPYFADTYLDGSLSDIPLWLANYGNNHPSDHAGWTRWTFLQYSDNGSVPGIGAPVDLNEYDGTEEQLMANMLSVEDANYIIERWIAHEYELASDDDQERRHRLANELRKASGQEPQSP